MKRGLLVVLMLVLLAGFPCRAQAAKKKTWAEKNGYMIYLDKNGKRAKGVVKIGNRTFYFDEKGYQHIGWQRIDGQYYYFRYYNGREGYMVKSRTMNGVRLQSNGKAVLNSYSKKKLDALVHASYYVECETKPLMDLETKLKKMFSFTISKFKYRGSPKFVKTTNWEIDYAMKMFKNGHGSCYEYGAVFAFFGNALGIKSYAISSGGHGWAEVRGNVFDPAWAQVDKKHSYYDVDYDLSGKGGRPRYKQNRTYVKKI